MPCRPAALACLRRSFRAHFLAGATITLLRTTHPLMAGSTRRALALLVCFGAASVGADYGATSPKSLSIVLDALTSGLGEEGQEFPVAKDGAVMENWAAVTENLADDWDTTVTLHNIETSRFIMRSSVERHFGAPRLDVSDPDVISPRIEGVQHGGRLHAPGNQGTTSSSRGDTDKDLVVMYNCLTPGTAKLLLTIPFSSDDEDPGLDDADADTGAAAAGGGAAAAAADGADGGVTLTLDDGDDDGDADDADDADVFPIIDNNEDDEDKPTVNPFAPKQQQKSAPQAEAGEEGQEEEATEQEDAGDGGNSDGDGEAEEGEVGESSSKGGNKGVLAALDKLTGAGSEMELNAKKSFDLPKKKKQQLKHVDYTVGEPDEGEPPKAAEDEVQRAVKAKGMAGSHAPVKHKKETLNSGKAAAGLTLGKQGKKASGVRRLEQDVGGDTVVAFAWSISCNLNPMPGFRVQLAGPAAVVEVADDGLESVAEGWEIESSETMAAKDPLKLHHVPASENATRFLISLSATQGMAQPFERPEIFVNAAGREVASPVLDNGARLGGSAAPVNPSNMDFDADSDGQGGPQTFSLFGKTITVGGQYQILDVVYNCLQPGTATIAISIPFPGENFAPVSFTWKKDCGGAAISPLVAISLVEEAATSSRDETATTEVIAPVVKGGAVLPGWAGVVDALSYQPAGVDKEAAANPAYVVDAHTGVSTFQLEKIGGENAPMRFGEPTLVVLPTTTGGSGGSSAIISPVVTGSGHKGGQIFNLHPKLSHSLKGGRTISGVAHLKMPPPLIKVQYNCLKPGKATLSLTIPFHLAAPIKWTWVKDCGGVPRQFFSVSTAEKLVVRDGVATDEWNEENTMENSVGRPDSPTGLDIATVDSSESSITFYLGLHGGQDLVDLVGGQEGAADASAGGGGGGEGDGGAEGGTMSTGRSIAVRSEAEAMGEDGRESPLETAFLKDWGADTSQQSASAAGGRRGGGGRTGAMGGGAVVGAVGSIPEHLQQQGYGTPLVRSSDPSICHPGTGGIARKGGTVHVGDTGVQGGKGEELIVRFNCLKPGKAVLTVLIPLPLYADVTFSFIKVCQLAPVEGMMVGTEPGEDDVVSDGTPWVFFDPSPEAEGKRVVMQKDMLSTDFHVWLKPHPPGKKTTANAKPRARLVDFKAPTVSASPEGVCSPRIGGAMRKGGQLSSDEPEVLTVRYNCFAGGSTLITVRIESEDGTHDAVAWSFRKDNGPSVEKLLAAEIGKNQQQQKLKADEAQRTNPEGVLVVAGALAVLVALFAAGEVYSRRSGGSGSGGSTGRLGSSPHRRKQGQD